MTPTLRHVLVATLVFSASCASGASIDVTAPNPRLAGARLYVIHKSGYRSQTWGGAPDIDTLYFSTDAMPSAGIESCVPSESCYGALDNARLAAVVAPDGHAAAISIDDGATWRYVALEGHPFLCRHHAARSPAELWVKVPTTRALVAGIFRDPDAHADAAQAVSGNTTTKFESEAFAALAYAAMVNDESLWIEIARGFGAPAKLLEMVGSNRAALVAAIAPIARARPAVRAVLIASMASPDAATRMRVADVLATSGAEEAQDAIATAFINDDVPDDGEALRGEIQKRNACWARAAEAAAIATISAERHAGSPQVRESLHRATHSRVVCPHDDNDSTRKIGESVRAALASLGE